MKRTLVLLLALAFALPATTIATAEAVFIAGGDQSNYVDEWTDTPLTYRNVDVYRIDATGGRFDLVRWAGKNGTAYQLTAEAGVLSSTQPDGSAY